MFAKSAMKEIGCNWKGFGGPGEIRTLDLFHAMEARSQLRHRPAEDVRPENTIHAELVLPYESTDGSVCENLFVT